MAEPACLAISSRKARSGSQRISKRHPASSHHKDRVHTLAPRSTRGIGFNGGTGATEKAPRMCETLRVGGPVWAHFDDYMPKRDVRSSGRSSCWSTAVRPEFGSLYPAAASPSGSPTRRWSPKTGLPLRPSWEPSLPGASDRRSRRPCHRRAISSGHERYPAVNHGHSDRVGRVGICPSPGMLGRPKLHGMQGVKPASNRAQLPCP
jgi:hypothetical protein